MTTLSVMIILSVILFSQTSYGQTNYPLQVKYPDIMLYKIETDRKIIALTFDDGPDQRFTPKILDVLNKHKVKGSFFLLGTRIEKYPDVARRIKSEGHEIGNHTYWHPDLTKSGKDNLIWEIEKNEQAIRSVIGIKTDLFRAPYGALNEELVETLGEKGYRGIGWSVDSEDWKSLTAKEIKQNIIQFVHPGAIILLHSAGHWTQDLSGTVEAIDELIPILKNRGYEFVTVSDLWALK